MNRVLIGLTILIITASCTSINSFIEGTETTDENKTALLSASAATATTIAIEAEDGADYRPFMVKSDRAASGQIYIGANSDSLNSFNTPPNDGNFVYTFQITDPGIYNLFARVITPMGSINSYWIKLDSGAWSTWGNIGPANSWSWFKYGTSLNYTAGKHTIRLAYREMSIKLDKLIITKDLNYTPSGTGDPIASPAPVSFTSDTVTKNGNLRVANNQLCNSSGTPVQLRGFSTHGIQWYPLYFNTSIPNIVKSWNIDLIRTAMYVEDYYNGNDFWNGYMAHTEEMKQWVKNYVQDAIHSGIYVIIDWHIHGNPANYTQSAVTFFTEMSQTFGGYPNVIFEICNEPVGGVPWSDIKGYAQQVIKAIRDSDPDQNQNIIIVGTPNWCQTPDIAANDPITGYNNIMYSLHFYAASHHEDIRMRVRDAVTGSNNAGNNPGMKKIPLFVTEWGTSDYGVSQNDFNESQVWMDLMNTYKLSWVNWSFSHKDESSSILLPGTSMAGPWTSADLTASGQWVVNKLPERNSGGTLSSSAAVSFSSASALAVSSKASSKPASSPSVNGALKVQTYQNGPATGYNQINERLMLVNTGPSPIALSTVKIRYYIKMQGIAEYIWACDYSPLGSGNVYGTFASINPAQAGADQYNEITFAAGAGSLDAGKSVEIQCRISKKDWSNWDCTQNYSYNPATAYTDWGKVTLYINGSRVWGTEPGGSAASSSVLSTASSAPISSVHTASAPSSAQGYITLPAKIEAESFTAMSGIQTQDCSEGTLNIGWTHMNDWIDYQIYVPATGSYSVDFRLATINNTMNFNFKSGSTLLGSVTIPNTGGWQTWQTVTKTVTLQAGYQTLRIECTMDGFNINWLELKPISGNGNKALNKSFTADSYQDSTTVPAKAADGSTSTLWQSQNSAGAHWIYVDLGSEQSVGRWSLKLNGFNGGDTAKNLKQFTLQYSSDTYNWVNKDSISDNTASSIDRSFTATSARYWRLFIENSGNEPIARLLEFELF